MKTKLFVIAALFFPAFAIAQSDEANYPERAHQVGVNATRFVKEIFSFNNIEPTGANPYILTYKYIKHNSALRVGIGGSSVRTKTNPNTGQALSTSVTQSFSGRIGYEFRENLSKRWFCYYGIDGVYNYDLTRFTSQTPATGFPPIRRDITNNSENFSMGGGGVLGFEFRLAGRVSFNVETQGYFLYSENRTQEKNFFFLGSNSSSFSSANSFQIVLPTALFFVVSL